MKQSSLKINMILNTIRGVLGIIFPLISFPYVSRVLGAENLGKYNFANSIVSYFVLLSALGIYSYTVREGARFRDDKQKIKKLSDEVFTINMVATVASYILLLCVVLLVNKLHDYTSLLFVLSFQIIFKTIGVEWIYTIYEDFLYITIRSIVIQMASLLFMFAFIHTKEDYVLYAAVVTFASGGSSVFNFLHAKKYLKINFTKKLNLKRHLKPILLIFATSVAITIYVSSDTTILGFLCNDETVGIYSVSVKVYNIVKTILISILSVAIPRLAFYLGNNNLDKFSYTVNNLFKTLISLVLPAVVGIFVLSKEIVLIVAGNEYLRATSSLKLLSIALALCLFSWTWGQCVLMTLKKEKILFYATTVSACVNIVMNFFLIPLWNENAAAITTIVAEGICFVINAWYGKKYVVIQHLTSITIKVGIGCAMISLITHGLRFFQWSHWMIFVVVDILLSVAAYTGIEIILKNECFLEFFKQIKEKIQGK